jgi:hypothetical protein
MQLKAVVFILLCKVTLRVSGSGFGGLVDSMLASGSRVRGFLLKKSSSCIPSEGKSNNLSHVPTLGHVKDPISCSSLRADGKIRVFSSLANRGLSRRVVRSASGDDGRNYLDMGHRGPVYKA